jgi:hypothetical protein
MICTYNNHKSIFEITKKKCVAYPQEDFLFIIHHKASQRLDAKNKKMLETFNQPIKIISIIKKIFLVPQN